MKRILEVRTPDGETYKVNVDEDDSNYYIDYPDDIGEIVYPKSQWTLKEAVSERKRLLSEL